MSESLNSFLKKPALNERSKITFNFCYVRYGESVEVDNKSQGDDYGNALIYAGRVLSIDNGQYRAENEERLAELRQKREITNSLITDELSKVFPDHEPKEILSNLEP